MQGGQGAQLFRMEISNGMLQVRGTCSPERPDTEHVFFTRPYSMMGGFFFGARVSVYGVPCGVHALMYSEEAGGRSECVLQITEYNDGNRSSLE